VFSSLTFHVLAIKRFHLHRKLVYFSLGMRVRGIGNVNDYFYAVTLDQQSTIKQLSSSSFLVSVLCGRLSSLIETCLTPSFPMIVTI